MGACRRFYTIIVFYLIAGLCLSCTTPSEHGPSSTPVSQVPKTALEGAESSQTISAQQRELADSSDNLRINVSLLPELPRAGDTFQVTVQPKLPESHPFLHYQWFINDQEVFGENKDTFNGQAVRGDKVSVRVTPSDGQRTGLPVTVSRHVLNSPPVIETLERARFDGNEYQTYLRASDPDQDPLEFTILEGPQGIRIDGQGYIRWQPDTRHMGRHKVTVSVKDDQGGEIVYTYFFTLGMSPEPTTKE